MRGVLGIDIGHTGALALVSRDGELIDLADMPILRASRPPDPQCVALERNRRKMAGDRGVR